MCVRHAATGSASSSRTVEPTASQSLSTSGSPNTASAQPAFGLPTIAHESFPVATSPS